MATDILDCYDDELDGFTDELAGDFDFLSSSEREGWLADQWMQVAEGGGWGERLEQTLVHLRESQLGLASLETAALGAFSSFIRREREEPGRSERALIRVSVLKALQEMNSAHLWHVETDVGSLPFGACYGRATWTPAPLDAGSAKLAAKPGESKPAPLDAKGGKLAAKPGEKAPPDKSGQVTVLPQRTFLGDAGPSYFWEPAPSTQLLHLGCGWSTPLRLNLGTFPWVYGHRLQSPAPGLSWRSSSTQHPAPVALRIAAGFWHPEGNLSADARDVVSAWRHWRETAGPLVAALPTSPTTAGEVYRVGERLVAHQTDDASAGINGPRGFICVAAYNFIQERFAAFFAMRRVLLRARRHLSPELRQLLMTNKDPCVRQQLGVAVLTLA